ncbi:MAG TPA: hypothetical protein VK177_14185 [Flavobacteriales bacterium]|nr:hypothetical protein [Flavobacteriales bacterium]
MGRKLIYTLTLLAYTQFTKAQETTPAYETGNAFNYKGILSAQATLATGYNTAFRSINYFLHGNLEYQLDQRISVRSDIYYFLNSKTPSDNVEPFAYQHGLFTGAQYHFLKGKLDWYAGIQPGLIFGLRQYDQLMMVDGSANPLESPKKNVAACFSFNTGINYYASKFFYLFLHARHNTGWFSDNYSVASLNEFRGSFGLGFYLRVWKPK